MKVLRTLLNHLTIILVLVSVVGMAFVYENKIDSLISLAVFWATIGASRLLLWRGGVRLASLVVVVMLWLVFAALVILTGGLSSINNVFFVSIAVIAGLLLGTRAALTIALLSSLLALGLVFVQDRGYELPQPYRSSPPSSNR